MADKTALAEEMAPGVRKRSFREKVRNATGERHRKVYVDETTWDYLMDMKKLLGLDNLRQTMVFVRHLATYGAEKRRDEEEARV